MAKTLLFSEYCLSSPVVGNLRNVTKCCWGKPRFSKGVQGGVRGCRAWFLGSTARSLCSVLGRRNGVKLPKLLPASVAS